MWKEDQDGDINEDDLNDPDILQELGDMGYVSEEEEPNIESDNKAEPVVPAKPAPTPKAEPNTDNSQQLKQAIDKEKRTALEFKKAVCKCLASSKLVQGDIASAKAHLLTARAMEQQLQQLLNPSAPQVSQKPTPQNTEKSVPSTTSAPPQKVLPQPASTTPPQKNLPKPAPEKQQSQTAIKGLDVLPFFYFTTAN